MEILSINEIAGFTHGRIIQKGSDYNFVNVSTDTRKIENNSIFIALKGERYNGNDFVKEAINKGARLCILDEIKDNYENIDKNVTLIQVKDTRKALLELAGCYRNKLNVKFIAVTGSTGKTSTKDLIYTCLKSRYKVFKTIGNFNNDIGLPLMMFMIDNSYDVAVLEMGMSNFNEIHRLTEIVKPDIAVITNIGISHIENLKTRENILKAKLEITDYFNNDNILVINNDNDLLSAFNTDNYKIIRVGIDNDSDFMACKIKLSEMSSSFMLSEKNSLVEEEFYIDLPGRHIILDSLLAIVCGRILNVSYNDMAESLENIEMTSMRLDVKKCSNYTVIDDSYNASPDSMKAAIDVLSNIKSRRKIAILGTMRELGDESYNAHFSIGKYAKEKGVDVLIASGEFSNAYSDGFNDELNYKELGTNDEIIDFMHNFIEKDDTILVKASRAMKFDIIVKSLTE